jgi:hypothetical protein
MATEQKDIKGVTKRKYDKQEFVDRMKRGREVHQDVRELRGLMGVDAPKQPRRRKARGKHK